MHRNIFFSEDACDAVMKKSLASSGSSNLRDDEDDVLSSVSCHLESTELWAKFHELGTEMIITKTGRYVGIRDANPEVGPHHHPETPPRGGLWGRGIEYSKPRGFWGRIVYWYDVLQYVNVSSWEVEHHTNK